MLRSLFFTPWAGLLLAASSVTAFLAGGCDRCMFFRVNAYVLDTEGQPLAGETVGVIPSQNYRWPRPPKRQDAARYIDIDRHGEVYKSEPNGWIAFDIHNTEPVGAGDLVVDLFFPPCVKFLIMLPDRQPSAYAATFIPGDDYEPDRFTYRHFDLQAGRALRTRYSDASGGLDVAIYRPPRDPNNPWSTPQPSLEIRILTREDASGEPPLPSDRNSAP